MENREETVKKVASLKEQMRQLNQELREECAKLDHPNRRSVTNPSTGSFGRTFIDSHWVCKDCGASGGFESEEAPPRG